MARDDRGESRRGARSETSARAEFDIDFQEGAGATPGFRIQIVAEESVGRNLVLRLTPRSPKPTLKMFTQQIPAKPDGLFRMVLTPDDAPAQFSASWVSQARSVDARYRRTSSGKRQFIRTEAKGLRTLLRVGYPLEPVESAPTIVGNLLSRPRSLDSIGSTRTISR